MRQEAGDAQPHDARQGAELPDAAGVEQCGGAGLVASLLVADDYGRYDAEADVLLAQLFQRRPGEDGARPRGGPGRMGAGGTNHRYASGRARPRRPPSRDLG